MKKCKHSATCRTHRSAFSRLATAILAVLAITAALTGCGGASHSSAGYVVSETAAAAVDMAPEESVTEEGALSSTAGIQPVSANRKLIRNVHLNVETTEFDSLISAINQSVTDLGGYLENSDISGTSLSRAYDHTPQRYASLTARIPASNLDRFIAQVDTQGNITNKSESTQDVTLQYSDVESRKKSLSIEQERLWALLEKADSVDAVIALESRLSEIRYQLESLESQLRTYDNQVDYSTVYLSVEEVRVFTPTSPDSVLVRMQKGFQKSLGNVGTGLVDFAVWFVTNIPILIVLAVIIAVLLLIVRLLTARSLRKHAKTAAAASQSLQNANAENFKPLCSGPPAEKAEDHSDT